MTSVIETINELLMQPRPHYAGDPKFRPSSLGTPCLRKIFYSYQRVEPDFPFPLRNTRITNLGDSIHDLIGDYLRKAGHLIDYCNKDGSAPKDRFNPGKFDYEFPLKDEDLNLSAKIDAVLWMDEMLQIGEWKSINAKGFSYLNNAKEAHIEQIAMYVFCINAKLKEGAYDHIPEIKNLSPEDKQVKLGRILYYCKDNSEMREFVFTPDQLQSYFTKVINKIMQVKNFSDQNVLPPTTQDWCQSCSYRTKCTKNYLPLTKKEV
jgi:CRISPR/Cas system-associated exonuclease Cas4 (RecB family)